MEYIVIYSKSFAYHYHTNNLRKFLDHTVNLQTLKLIQIILAIQFLPQRKHMATKLQYKPVNAVNGNNCCLLRMTRKT